MPTLGHRATAYTTLTQAQIVAELQAAAGDAFTAFGRLDVAALNWTPDSARWSVGQCLDHLVSANKQMLDAAAAALSGTAPPNVWTRVPLVPRLLGPMLVRSQAPTTSRKFVAPPQARPAAAGNVASDIVVRFVRQHKDAAAIIAQCDADRARHVVMTSPFVRFITYSVLDGWRLMIAHDHRHLQQARRVRA